MQFLLDRDQKRPGWYTHIMGMGCSKCHCAACARLFEFFLGSCYSEVTASVDAKKGSNASLQPGPVSTTSQLTDLDRIDNAEDDVAFTQSITQEIRYMVGKGEKAIDSDFYDDYYLPENFQKEIQRRTDSNLDLSDRRFDKGKEKPKSRKRNK
jgi:hypothetical protein